MQKCLQSYISIHLKLLVETDADLPTNGESLLVSYHSMCILRTMKGTD